MEIKLEANKGAETMKKAKKKEGNDSGIKDEVDEAVRKKAEERWTFNEKQRIPD